MKNSEIQTFAEDLLEILSKWWGLETMRWAVYVTNDAGATVNVDVRYREAQIRVDEAMSKAHLVDYLSHEVAHVIHAPLDQWTKDSGHEIDSHYVTAMERTVELLSRVFLRSPCCRAFCKKHGIPYPLELGLNRFGLFD